MAVKVGRWILRMGMIVLLPYVLGGCVSMSAELLRANVTVTGAGAVAKDGFYSANIDSAGDVSWRTPCDSFKERKGMMFLFVPLPPIFPLGDGKPLETAKQPFSVSLESKNGRRQDKDRLRASVVMGGTKTILPMEYETYYGLENTRWVYKFSSQFTCGDIKDAEFRLEKVLLDGIVLDPFLYRLDYHEGVAWEWGYLRS